MAWVDVESPGHGRPTVRQTGYGRKGWGRLGIAWGRIAGAGVSQLERSA